VGLYSYRKMWRALVRLCAIVWGVALLGAALPAVAADVQATGVRIADHKSGARLVVDVTDEIKIRIFTLADPYRVVVDMPSVEWKAESDTPLDSRGLVSGFRHGRFTPTTTRIVLDVTKPVKVAQSFVLAPSAAAGAYRVVVDVEPVSASEFDRLAR